ncbi:TetR/AcrR family transcriptional regulator [Thalassospira profundimaris]|uniref:TetR family transcriptional regulator n=1 Tax=Thalassospira profundimaris TaxID=502049 RepID=A0A367WKM5_9PROT|nr:TetR/AcrR family transcriptional regulator [Thalassospira profundimaris]RCK41967.1 TetR family transcriptional regulator [Thalassospira profundimaris]
MARNKTIPDSQVLDTIFETVLETGPSNLTFARASKACGLSPATLVQRYGTRDALLLATLLRAWDRLDAETHAADQEEPSSPNGAIEILLRLMPPETADRDTSNGLLVLHEDIRNPQLRARGAAWGHRLAAILGRRLSKQPEEGRKLGWQMASIWQGAHTWWAFTREQPADQTIREMLQEWVARNT